MKYLKRVLAIVLAVVLLCALFSGCGEKETELLDVWCTDGSQGLAFRSELMEQQVNKGFDIDVTVFGWHYSETGYEERTVELQNRLMAGDGPDVVIFMAEDFRDIRKLVDSGCFMDISGFVEKSRKYDPDDFVEGIMQDGWYGDECYYMPLGYSVAGYVTTDIILGEQGWTLPEDCNDLMEQITAFAEDDNGYGWFLRPERNRGKDTRFQELFEATGIELVNYETGTVLPDEAQLTEFLTAYQGIFDRQYLNYGDAEEAYIYRSQCDREMFEDRDYCYDISTFGLCNIYPYQCLLPESGPHLNVLHGYDGEVAGRVSMYVAISAGSDRAEDAWKLIERMLGKTAQELILTNFNLQYDFPVRKDCIARWIEDENAAPDLHFTEDSKGNLIQVLDVSREIGEAYEAEVESAVAVYNSPAVTQMLWDTMQPYFAGTAEYETCLEELRGKLEFYVKE